MGTTKPPHAVKVDTVHIKGEGTPLTLPMFLELPLTARIRYILQGQLTFSCAGKAVDPAAALNFIMKLYQEK